ncbi:hypothetical protein BDA96_07G070500 [Sorghum bicolor]|uniref:Uncharacterized protein n=2 Tax=Sorghum bicolor TaxID=4558 RepID=A0A921U8Y0_SORBI|nr:hypothetical protein BDA96_07G070500 [Sorghum bicolor]KXG24647.1 hypothetical protein SORBI_3007G067800 [Sorghum bicolor]
MIGIESIEDSNSYPPITPIAGIHQYRGEPAHIRVGSTNMTRSSGRRLPRRRASPPATDLATMVEDICSCFSTSVSMFS